MSRYFTSQEIDDSPQLLEQSYNLRYQVYCLERTFLRAEDYPSEWEVDEFDPHSIHVGVLNTQRELVATARLVQHTDTGLPLLRHCSLFPDHAPLLDDPTRRVIEVSRLVVSRKYNRRAGDGFYGLQGASPLPGGHERREGGEIVLNLYKALYQASKRHRVTHWLAATEKSLQRLVAKYGFPFRAVGPETDYYGCVSPYLMDLDELNRVISSRRIPMLDEFVQGLEPEFLPVEDDSRPSGDVVRMRALPEEQQERLLVAFRRAVADMPWYRILIGEHGVHPEQVVDVTSFSSHCPVLTKLNTFDRFPLNQLAATTKMADMATVLTSSGHGGRFSFGLSTRSQAAASGYFIDQAMDAAFHVASQSTLAINCLPMGVGFTSECMTVATTSVREDMAVGLIQAFGSYYDQILLVADPLFMKRLMDFASARAVDWGRHRVHVVLGEEIFGEYFRGYVATCLGLNVNLPEHGYVMSSFGVGELGLHLCYETPATIALRRAAWLSPDLARDLLGVAKPGMALPAILAFNPLRTLIEVVQPDALGYGHLTISMLDVELPIPLLRYQTGDVARLLDVNAVTETLNRHGVVLPGELPAQFLALQGRAKDVLPNGSHVALYKDALYADLMIARQLTGAFRVVSSENGCTMHIQFAADQSPVDSFEQRLLAAMPEEVRPERLVLWPYSSFPFGMTVDYERKFAYYVPGER